MLRARITTAIISLVILGAVLFVVPAPAAKLLIALIILVGAWEWSGFLALQQNAGRYAFVALIAVLMAGMIFLLPEKTHLLMQVACIWWIVAFVWTFVFPTPIPIPVRWICGVLVLLPVFVAMETLYDRSPEFLLLALMIVWAADVGAYFCGKTFGRVKLAPSISPGKTWEGVFGGLVVVAALAFGWANYADMPIAVVLPFFLALAAQSIVGDLTVSMFKRTAGVKDSGTLFPGHGGVLDRIDSLAAAAPLFALGLVWLGLV
jgi:phosphatidate cytidylyltransferase